MNDDDVTALVDHLAAGLPETTVPPGLVVAGRRARRRRRRASFAGVVAAVVATALAGTAVPHLVGDRAAGPSSQPFPAPPAGTKWVGIGRLVLAIPAAWPVTDLACDVPASKAVYASGHADFSCSVAPRPPVSVSVEVGALSAPAARGVEPEATTCSTHRCEGTRTFPDHDAYFTVFAPTARQVDQLLGSATLLPPGWTTVPFALNSTLPRRIATDMTAGLHVRVSDSDRHLIRGASMTSDPAIGTPIRAGGTVTITPQTR